MRSPSIVPKGFDFEVCIVLDDLGRLGRLYREIDEERATREAVTQAIIAGQFNAPARVVAFNIAEGGWRDITEDIGAISSTALTERELLSEGLRDFVEWVTGESVPANMMDR